MRKALSEVLSTIEAMLPSMMKSRKSGKFESGAPTVHQEAGWIPGQCSLTPSQKIPILSPVNSFSGHLTYSLLWNAGHRDESHPSLSAVTAFPQHRDVGGGIDSS